LCTSTTKWIRLPSPLERKREKKKKKAKPRKKEEEPEERAKKEKKKEKKNSRAETQKGFRGYVCPPVNTASHALLIRIAISSKGRTSSTLQTARALKERNREHVPV
jgi:hypothetical protein